jgi:hypothetical protein
MDPVAAVWEDGRMAIPPPLPHEATFTDEPAPKKSRWRLPLIILGLIFAGLLLLVLLVAAYIWLSDDLPVRPEDRDVLVTLAWVQEQGFDVDFDPAEEVVEKIRNIDKSYELTYEYYGLDVFILCEVGVDPSVSDAKSSFFGLKTGQSIAFSLDNTEVRLRPKLLSWGDDSKCALLYDDEGDYVGNYFACRTGTRTFSVVVMGLDLTEREDLGALLLPILRRVKTYKP